MSPRNFAQYCQAERQPGPHPIRPGPGAARQEPATSSGARPPSRAAARRKRKLIRRQTKVQTVGLSPGTEVSNPSLSSSESCELSLPDDRRRRRSNSSSTAVSDGGPTVRIHLPPAESPQTIGSAGDFTSRYRWFESCSLQWGVRCELSERQSAPGSARSAWCRGVDAPRHLACFPRDRGKKRSGTASAAPYRHLLKHITHARPKHQRAAGPVDPPQAL